MIGLIGWWRQKQKTTVATLSSQCTEWVALKDALAQHDFNLASVNLRAWSLLPECDPKRLLAAANEARFSAIEVNKLSILFDYYSNRVALAYENAQKHIKDHGFDTDLHVVSLVCLYLNNQFVDAYTYLKTLSDEQMFSIGRADYWQMVASIRWANNDIEGLKTAIDRALELAPRDGALLQTGLAMYIELGAEDKIYSVRRQLADLSISSGYAHSLCLLALGENDQGWAQMEARYDVEDAHRYFNLGLKAHPRWQGTFHSGLRLLVTAEQGLGDTIQMSRYLPLLQTNSAITVVFESQSEALTLLQHNFPTIPMVERNLQKAPEVSFDCWIGMMSLPYYLRAWGKDIPSRSGYLQVPPENSVYWRERVLELSRRSIPKIGLAWSGQPNHRADRRRSIPFELMMGQVRGIKASFFALQTQVPQVLPANVMNVSEEIITLADTAALIEQMDLVITVDTSVVHIAGALGKETWLLLPKRYEWRWGLEGEDNDWYDTVKVIRQTEHANWGLVLRDVFEHRLPEYFNL